MRQDEWGGACHLFFPLIKKGFLEEARSRLFGPGPPHHPGLASPQCSHSRSCFTGSLCAQGPARCTDGGRPFCKVPGPLDTSRSYRESSEQKDFQVTGLEPAHH